MARPAAETAAVRRATAADLPECAAIINEYIDATGWLPRVIDHRSIEDMYSPALLERRTVFVVEDMGGVAGYLSMDHKAGFIHAVYVRPHARGHSLGKALLDAAKQAQPQGFDLTVFEPNAEALRFYMREGLVEVREGYKTDTDEGVPTLLMRWTGAVQ